jgi:hypothetical protein
VQPTCNTTVPASIVMAGRTTGLRSAPRVLAVTTRQSRPDTRLGWCCTFVARGAAEAAGRPAKKAQQSPEHVKTLGCSFPGHDQDDR